MDYQVSNKNENLIFYLVGIKKNLTEGEKAQH